ncbi:MAG: PEP/pyruvate-binding domain-containing protein [Pseudomonadota bacterium]
MSFLYPQSSATDARAVGGKAAALGWLAVQGFKPPPFLVISPSAFEMGGAKHGLAESLRDAMPALGPGPYAVRSSGFGEDGALDSHAGQFDTFLNVPVEKVVTRAHDVWRSGFSEGLAAYRTLRAAGAADPPAVIVQQMIQPVAAGVAFSADPVSGRRDHAVVTATRGLADTLVAGVEDGQTWTVEGDILSGPATDPVLTDQQVRAVADLARRVHQTAGTPQDIEWAIDEDGLHILQARPITTPLRPSKTPDNSLVILDNSNIIESYPGIVSPLTYGFAVHVYARVYRAFVGLMGVGTETVAQNAPVFDNMLSRFDGRVYYNLLNWYRALSLLPGFSLNRAYMETMMGVSEPLPASITQSIGPQPANGLRRVTEYTKLAGVALRLGFEAARLSRTRRRFYLRLEGALNSGLDLSRANPTDLAREYRRIECELLDRWDAPLINDFLCMIAFGASRALLEKWLGPDGLALHNDVMIGQGDIVSAEPAQRIARMGQMVAAAGLTDALLANGLDALEGSPAIQAEVDAYLSRFGDRCTEELKLESIPLTEDPRQLVFAIVSYAQRPPSTHSPKAPPDWAAVFAGRPMRRMFARWIVNWAKDRVRDRENLRFERTRVFGHARKVFMALGREFTARNILDTPRDILFLTPHEALGAVEGFGLSPDLKAIAMIRKAQDAASAHRSDPPERITYKGLARSADPAPVGAAALETGNERLGTGCSAGVITGKARVVRDPRTERLEPGEVLVARHTDPGWIAVFANAAAIVVERGSPLSHSAIVARELGIPCVVGLKSATAWIETGDEVEVDGASGRVRRVSAIV